MFLDYFIASKEEVLTFLERIKKIIKMNNFKIDVNLNFDFKKEDNVNTMDMLNYSIKDVLNELQELTFSEYCQSVPDLNHKDNIPYHVFFKTIQEREIYIKVKVRNNKIIVCKSFHFAKFSHRDFPYNK